MRVLQRFFLGSVIGLAPTAASARAPAGVGAADAPPAGDAGEPPAGTAEPAPGPVDALSEGAAAPVVAVTPTAQAQLDEAVRRYQFGERDAAQGMFAALVIDPAAPSRVRQSARVYLGELLYVAGDKAEARRFFEQVLQREPAFEVDPFRHPPEVVGFFNYVRAYHTAPPEPATEPAVPLPPTLVPPSPPSAMLGHGVYHFRHGKPGRGMLYLGLQGTFLAVDAVLWAGLLRDRSYLEGDEAERVRLNRNRTLTGVMAAGYWGTWLTSAVDANIHWRRVEGPARARATSSTALLLPPVQVRGSF